VALLRLILAKLTLLNRILSQLTSRILASFILFALYAPHPIAINPFKSVLFVTFVKERDKARAAAAGGVAPNEPLVWVLWKILKGDGEDVRVCISSSPYSIARLFTKSKNQIGPYSPSALARSLLPPNFRATKLILDDTLYRAAAADLYLSPIAIYELFYSIFAGTTPHMHNSNETLAR
jgi:hypothetical protein